MPWWFKAGGRGIIQVRRRTKEATMREGMNMTAPHQEKNAYEAHNRAVVCVIAGLTIDEAEALSAAIIHEKNNLAPNARGTIATGKEQNIARMLGDGHNNALPQQKKKKKKKKKKNKSAGKTTAPDTKKQG